jgi:divalent metal cation (Fe/Co/Zn/Cd) transporter
MPDDVRQPGDQRRRMLARALRLVIASVAVGLLSGAFSVTIGLLDHSVGVFAVGLGVLADVTGSAVLIWRFRAERRQPGRSEAAETRAAVAVAAALAVVGAVLAVQSATALASRSHPNGSDLTLVAAAISLVVLAPLAYAKRRLGRRMASRALQGDAALSAVGAVTSVFALTGLALYRGLGWWWADRVVGLLVAAGAAAEAWRTLPRHRERA